MFGPYGSHQRQCVGRGPLRVEWSWVGLGNAAIAWGESSLGQRVHGTPRVPLLHVPVRGALTYRVGQRHLEALPGQAVLIRAGVEYTVAYGAESRVLAVQIQESEFLRALAPLGGASAANLPAALEMALPEDALGRLARCLGPLWDRAAIGPDSPRAAHFRRSLTATVAAMVAVRLPCTPQGSGAAARLRCVEDWIDAHLGEPIDLPALCRVAGIEARGLRKSFQQRRGVAPMQWVWSRRMAAARHRLLSAAPGDSVIRIAIDQGITHPGRFSIDYRARYGESPSVTLARTQGRG